MLIYVLARRSCFYPVFWISGYSDNRISGYPDFLTSGHPDIRISGHPDVRISENPRLTNRGSGNARISSICSILVVSLATNECVLVNASALEMLPGGSESYGIYGT